MNKKIATLIAYFNLLVSLLVTIFYTRILLQYVGDDYGVFSYSQSLVNYLNLFQTTMVACFVRFATIENQETKSETKKTNTIFFISLICLSFLSLIVGFVFFALFRTGIFVVSGFNSSQTSLFYILFSISIVHCCSEIVMSFFYVYITFRKQFIFIRIINLLNTILYPVFALLSLKFGGGMLAVCIVMFSVKTILSIAVLIYSITKLKIRFRRISLKVFFAEMKDIIVFAGFILVNTIIDTFNASLDKILLGSFGTAALITTYQLGMTFSVNITSVSLALTSNYVPLVHELAQKNELQKVDKLFQKIGMFQSLVLLLIVGGFVACGEPFIRIWVGAERIEAYLVGVLLMLSSSFTCSYNISIEYQRSLNKHKVRALVYVIAAILNFSISISLLAFVKTINPIVSCLIGTLTADVLMKWVAMSIYNQKAIKLSMDKHIINYCEILIISFVSVVFAMGMKKIIPSSSDLHLFLIGGFSYVLCFFFAVFLLLNSSAKWRLLKRFARLKDED